MVWTEEYKATYGKTLNIVPIQGKRYNYFIHEIAMRLNRGEAPVVVFVGDMGNGKSEKALRLVEILQGELNMFKGSFTNDQLIYDPLEFMKNLLDMEDEAAYIDFTGISTDFGTQAWIDSVGYLDGKPVWFPQSEWVDQFAVELYHDWTLQDAGSVMQTHLRLTYISKTSTPHAGIAFLSPEIFFWVWCEGIGIEETRGKLQANLYPNPVTECSKFELPNNTQFPINLTIMDPNGRILHQQIVQEGNTIPFPRINLGEGIYMYSLVDAGKKFLSGKFIFEQ